MSRTASQRTRDRLLYLLKTRGPQSTPTLARKLTLTSMAVRLHLQELEKQGLLESRAEAEKVGRPAKVWSLTARGHQRFPEGYGDLAVDLLREAQRQFGNEAVDTLLEARMRKQTEAYRDSMPASSEPLGNRVRALARLRTEDGYMAEVQKHRDGGFSLIENHCPVCAAAQLCVGLCNTELQMFEDLLGRDVDIERQEHVLQDDRRCTYRITPRASSRRS